MDGFLGTSIQYSEQQIKLLEEEYAKQKAKDVEELINSGFLDTDYEDSTGEYSDSEYEQEQDINDDADVSLSSIEFKELENDILDDVTSTSDYTQSPSLSTSSTPLISQLSLQSNRNSLALVLSADISAIKQYVLYDIIIITDDNGNNKEDNNNNDDTDIDDAEIYKHVQRQVNKIYQYELEYSSAEESIHRMFDDISLDASSGVLGFIKFIVFIILAIVIITHSSWHQSSNIKQQCNCQQQQQQQHPSSNSRFKLLFDKHVQHNLYDKYIQQDDDTDERDEYKQQQQQKQVEIDNKLNFDIIYHNKLCPGAMIKIQKSDLIDREYLCNNINNDPQSILQLHFDNIIQSPRKYFTLPFMKIPKFKLRKETMQDPVGSNYQRRILTFGIAAIVTGAFWLTSASTGSSDQSI